MRRLECALLASLVALASPAAADEPRTLLVLSNVRDHARDAVLVDALRIYTRDLGRTVRIGGPAPSPVDAAALDRVATDARRAGAEIVIWFATHAPLLYALRVSPLELRETALESDDPLLAARTAALKVRALLAHPDEPTWRVPEIKPSPAPSPPSPSPVEPPPSAPDDESVLAPPPPPPPAIAKPVATPTPSPPPSSVRATSPSPPRRPIINLTAQYLATVPTQPVFTRHGLLLRVSTPFGRRVPMLAFADAAFASEPTATVDGNPVSARVWPVGAGVAFRLLRRRWHLQGGPRVSLQIIDANTVTSSGRAGAARRYSAGLGGFFEAAWQFADHFAAVAGVGAEALVPRQEFGTGGRATTDLGWVQFTFAAGLTASLP